ncbi:unnamed protein product [Albugo candida]|uniref:RxLR effector protein n=1 Tax=Albugo candida TaxID=65357 RepID=A0A024FVE4_9STRA|nr:unnamed protein product [Albugo candida]|eukprot:CCI11095.1 unnamed protein product [Albugo candida]
MVGFIHVAVCGLLTTSVESATTRIGGTHSVATNADTAGMNEIEETQRATLKKKLDATANCKLGKVERDVQSHYQTTSTGSRSLMHFMEPRGSDNLRATSSENGSISKPIRPLSGRQHRMLASNPPNEDASKGSSRGDKSRSTTGRKKVSFATADAGSSNENSMTSTQGTKFPAGTLWL